MYLFCDAVLRVFSSFAKIQRVGAQRELQSYWVLSNADPDLLKNNKATKPALMLGHHRPAFRWWADDGTLLVVFGSSLPLSSHQLKQPKLSELDPSEKNFWIRACVLG